MCKVVVLPIKPFVFLTFLYCLFIMDLSLQSNKTNNWSADNLNKNMSPQLDVHLSLCYSQVTLVSHTLFASCQLTITWMSTTKLNTDFIWIGHQASNAQSLQENSQSECTFYCSHIINNNYWFFIVVIDYSKITLILIIPQLVPLVTHHMHLNAAHQIQLIFCSNNIFSLS